MEIKKKVKKLKKNSNVTKVPGLKIMMQLVLTNKSMTIFLKTNAT